MKGGALEVGKQVQLPLFGHRFLYNQLYINAIVTRIMIEIKDIENHLARTKSSKAFQLF
jgi:hypothetical protein